MRLVERLSYFSFYPADYLLDTTELSLVEHGAYLTLMIRYYWEGGISEKDKYRNCRTEEDRRVVDAMIARFFHVDNGRIIHNRIEREFEAMARFVAHQSKAGKASAEARGKRKSLRVNGERSAAVALPDWLDANAFNAWIKIRPAKARTPEAQQAAITKLEKFRAAGHDPNAIVNESLSNGWQGIFADKTAKKNVDPFNPGPGKAVM